MKTVCFFSGDITRCGGTERVSVFLADRLSQTGNHRIIFLSLVEQNAAPFFPIPPKIERYVLKKDGKWRSPGPKYLPMVPALRHFLRKQRIDIIIDIDIVLDVLSIPASRGLPVKVISWEHFNYHYEQEFLYRRMIAALSVRFSDYMVTLTGQDKVNYEKKGRRKEKIDFIYNPIELPPKKQEAHQGSRCSAQEPILITVGSLNRRKGTDLAAKIIPEILGRYRDWKWYFLGDGEDKDILEEVLRRHHLEGRLILTGNVTDVGKYLKRASLYVMTSRTEGLPMCLLEAKANSLPCVCFDIQTGPSEIVKDGVNGFLVPPFHTELMIEKVSLLMENEDLRKRFSKDTAIGIQKFSPDAVLSKWERVLDEV